MKRQPRKLKAIFEAPHVLWNALCVATSFMFSDEAEIRPGQTWLGEWWGLVRCVAKDGWSEVAYLWNPNAAQFDDLNSWLDRL
jgi:hypothetical protein